MYSDEMYSASLKDVELALDIAKRMGINPKMAILLTTLLDFSTALMTQDLRLKAFAEVYSMKKYGNISDKALDAYLRGQEKVIQEIEKKKGEGKNGFKGYV